MPDTDREPSANTAAVLVSVPCPQHRVHRLSPEQATLVILGSFADHEMNMDDPEQANYNPDRDQCAWNVLDNALDTEVWYEHVESLLGKVPGLDVDRYLSQPHRPAGDPDERRHTDG